MKKKKLLTAINILIALAIIIISETNYINSDFVVEESGEINVYFCPKDNCSNHFEKKILQSNEVKCAFYDLTNQKIIKSINDKKKEILIDEDNFEGFGKKIKSEGLMHNKFCVLDEKIVITGSYNPTQNNFNQNNIIIIESETLAKNYLEEFEEIKNGGKEKTKHSTLTFNNKHLQNYFCPDDKCKEKILRELSKAKEKILFMTFTFTDKDISNLLIKKHKEGLEIKGIIEKFQNSKYSVYQTLASNKINISYYEGEGFQHNKVFIIDDKTVITGSYNPTNAANNVNDENIIILTQEDIVKDYVTYFEELSESFTNIS